MNMTEQEAIDVINEECDTTFIVMHMSMKFANALAKLMGYTETLSMIRKVYLDCGGNKKDFDSMTEEDWKRYFENFGKKKEETEDDTIDTLTEEERSNVCWIVGNTLMTRKKPDWEHSTDRHIAMIRNLDYKKRTAIKTIVDKAILTLW